METDNTNNENIENSNSISKEVLRMKEQFQNGEVTWSDKNLVDSVTRGNLTKEDFTIITGKDFPEDTFLVSIREDRLKAIASMCEGTIYNGTDVTLSDNAVEHFSFSEHDQLNIKQAYDMCHAGLVEQFPYHADNNPCKYYLAKDIETIFETLMNYKLYHITRCNALNMWIKNCNDTETLKNITYSSEIPDEYKTEVLINIEGTIA